MNLPLTLGACLAPGALGLALLLNALWGRCRPRTLILCPGPSQPPWLRLLPQRLFLIRACWYDLRGLAPDPSGAVVCPECSRRSFPRHTLRSTRRWRSTPIAALLITLSLTLANSSEVRSWRWTRRLPTAALIPLAYVPARWRPPHISTDLAERLVRGRATPSETNALIPALVRDLKDDEVRWNGLFAIDALRAIGPPAFPALLAALDSPDWQQRQLAAHLLRTMNHPPTEALTRVTVEGLRHDALPWGPARGPGGAAQSWISNAHGGLAWLVRNPSGIDPHLARGMRSGDDQQRFLCAIAAGFSGRTRLIPCAVPILLDHLRDNDSSGDATSACAALYQFGPAILPRLAAPALFSPDRQQRRAARLLLIDFFHPPDSAGQMALRRRYLRLTDRFSDPAIELGIGDVEW